MTTHSFRAFRGTSRPAGFVLALLPGLLVGQPEPPPAISPNALGYSIKWWTIDEGLPSNHITGVAQSSDGYLWVATAEGLARFNGYEFRVYGRYEIPEFDGARLFRIAADAENRLFLKTGHPILIVMEHGEFRKLGPQDGLPDGKVRDLDDAPGHDTTVTVTMSSSGERVFLELHGGTFRPIASGMIDEKTGIRSIIAEGGQHWAITESRRLIRVHESGVDQTVTPERGGLGRFFRTNDGRLAVAGHRAIYACGEAGWSAIQTYDQPLPGRIRLSGAAQDRDGTFLMSSSEGLLHVDAQGKLRVLRSPSFARLANLSKILRDRQGNLWIPTVVGLAQIYRTPFSTWTAEHGLPETGVVSLDEDGEGTMWFACHGSVAYLEHNAPRIKIAPQHTELHEYLLTADPQAGAWVASLSGRIGLWRKDGQPVHPIPPPSVPGEKSIQRSSIFGTSQGDLWLMMRPRGLFRLPHGASSSDQYELVSSSNPVFVSAMAEDRENRLLVAVRGAGLYRFEARQAQPVVGEEAQKVPNIRALGVDPSNSIWALAESPPRVALLNQGNWCSLEVSQLGLPERGIMNMVQDDHGGFWFGTKTDGVARIDREALRRRLLDPSSPLPEAEWFDRSDGLATKACSHATSGATRSRDGRLWFATAAGVSVVDPSTYEAQRAQATPPPVRIESLSIDGKPVFHDLGLKSPGSITIPTGTRRTDLEFAAITFASPAKIRYRYRLRGYDDDWVEAGTSRRASFQRLPAGSYQFEVTSSDRFGSWKGDPAVLSLVVQPQWWERRSVHLSLILVIACLIWLFYTWRLAALRRRQRFQEEYSRQLINSQEQERKRLAGELHDGLGQHLLLIKNTTELAAHHVDPESPAAERLGEVSEIARDAIAEARTLTENLRPSELDRLGLRVATKAMIDKIAESSGISLESAIDSLDQDWLPEREIHIFRLIQEALNNIVKHSAASAASVEATRVDDEVQIIMEDSGNGFDFRKGGLRGHGLTSMQERANLLEGRLAIRSAPGAGCTVHITIPLAGNSKPSATPGHE